MLILIAAVHFILFRTVWGLRTRACGENPRAAETAGINVYRVRYVNVIASGALAGLGGSYFSLQQIGNFLPNMTGGRGFIALAAMKPRPPVDRKSTRLNSSHANISYAVFCLKKKKK